ncbi:hypothetical protein DSCW_57360 [Desulfosarcina widdelii]|uniref:Lipoprotein n=1 Tax=Desulfosarcina widdelii TaxID=947919 RepID=A0A5K7ZDQ5_9BACT|nr:hypothetical protein [Desulfosarcina widdelii]BBO78319.1 hypothetical protein DSCW_57360 [Desulfosarcina widdelii]
MSRAGFSFRLAVLAFCLFMTGGCAGGPLKHARDAFFIDGDPNAAVQSLEDEHPAGLSALLLFMEKGMLLHRAGRFSESIAELRQASNLMEKQDRLSVSQQAASILVNDWMTEYKGEYCERLWVHTYLMIDYLMIDRYEDALVEAKQALKIIDAYPEALSEAYFSLALIGLCYELLDEYNDAYILYERMARSMPDPEPVREALFRMGRLSGIEPDDSQASIYRASDEDHRPFSEAEGEAILFVGTGNGPVKVSGDILLPPGIRISRPRYENRSTVSDFVAVDAGDRRLSATTVGTDLNRVARISLTRRAKTIIAKEAARVFAKEAIAQQVEKEDDPFASFMTRLILMAMEEADTRSWQTLPARNTLLRLRLEPGVHHLAVRFEGSGIGHRIDLPPFTIHGGERVFFVVSATDRFAAVYGGISSDFR